MMRANELAATPPELDRRPTAPAAQHALDLDRTIHEPARLAILAVLSQAEEVDFRFLTAATGLTKGNLSRQAARLEAAGYLAIRKYYRGKIPATGYTLTAVGRAALDGYWRALETLRASARAANEAMEER
jgi:DNA-binding transcriptional ArsR family regulator